MVFCRKMANIADFIAILSSATIVKSSAASCNLRQELFRVTPAIVQNENVAF